MSILFLGEIYDCVKCMQYEYDFSFLLRVQHTLVTLINHYKTIINRAFSSR